MDGRRIYSHLEAVLHSAAFVGRDGRAIAALSYVEMQFTGDPPPPNYYLYFPPACAFVAALCTSPIIGLVWKRQLRGAVQ